MANITFNTLKSVSNINGSNYPIYIGFLSAENLKSIAHVPNFTEEKPHHQIALDIHHPPVDQWQRPLDKEKASLINTIYSDTTKNNLMANPVLIGVAFPRINNDAFIDVTQRSISDHDGNLNIIDDNYLVTVHFTESEKPLWILDGQHRIEGMKHSTQYQQLIPFVLLYDRELYKPSFLAEIFTHVTTGATPMKPLHQEWMRYAFDLDVYKLQLHKDSFETVIHLCSKETLGGINNPFHNKIQLNPYHSSHGYYAFTFNGIELEKLISENYYGKGGSKSPLDLAEEVVKILKAAEDLDNRKGDGGSKLFSNQDPHKILAEAFLSGALTYLVTDSAIRTKAEWKNFLVSDDRNFHRCDWSLQFVTSSGALSSSNGIPSKIVAKESFDVFFSDPEELEGYLLTDYLQGLNAQFKLTAYPATSAGRISKRSGASTRSVNVFANGGTTPFNVNHGGVVRDFIHIEPIGQNCVITRVLNPSYNPPITINSAKESRGLNISAFPHGHIIAVETISYSGDTRQITKIRLDKP